MISKLDKLGRWMFLAFCITIVSIAAIAAIARVEMLKLEKAEECICTTWLNQDQDVKCIVRKDERRPYMKGRPYD